MSESTHLFGVHIMALSRLWRAEIDRRLKPSGLSEARWRALRRLARNGGEMSQGKLAEQLGIRGATLVAQIDLLESAGWVRRHEAPNDRRSKLVRLTDEAAPLVQEIDSVIVAVREEMFAGIDEAALESCSRLLEDLCERVQRLRADDTPLAEESAGGSSAANRRTEPTARPTPVRSAVK